MKVDSPYAFLKSLPVLAQQHNHLNKHSNFQMPKEASKLKQLPLRLLSLRCDISREKSHGLHTAVSEVTGFHFLFTCAQCHRDSRDQCWSSVKAVKVTWGIKFMKNTPTLHTSEFVFFHLCPHGLGATIILLQRLQQFQKRSQLNIYYINILIILRPAPILQSTVGLRKIFEPDFKYPMFLHRLIHSVRCSCTVPICYVTQSCC